MVFVLYLAGLAVLIIVLALGLEIRAATRCAGRQLAVAPRAGRRTEGAGPDPDRRGVAKPLCGRSLFGRGTTGAHPVADRRGSRDRADRRGGAPRADRARLDWVFYRQLDEMRAARRAWLAPQSAKSDKAPVVGRTFEVSVVTQNSGAEPAVDIFADAAPFTVALSDAGSPSVDRSIRDALNHCLAAKPGDRTRVVSPNPAGTNDRTTLSVKRELIDWDVLYGTKILVVPGCYAYRTGGQTHHSAFCFFSPARLLQPERLGDLPGRQLRRLASSPSSWRKPGPTSQLARRGRVGPGFRQTTACIRSRPAD